jgi:hypothetical protein
VAKAWCGEVRSSGWSFYRRSGRGRGERWRAPARCACDGDGGAQWWRRDGSGRRGDRMARANARRQTELVRAIMARRRGGRWPAAIAPIACSRARGEGLTSGARLPEGANARGGGRAGVAGEWGRADSGATRARAREVGRDGLREGEMIVREGGREGLGRIRPRRGGGEISFFHFFFYFYFFFPFSF